MRTLFTPAWRRLARTAAMAVCFPLLTGAGISQTPRLSPNRPAEQQRLGQARLSNVLERITRQTGILVLADSTVADELVTTLEYDAITPENLERHLTALVREIIAEDEPESVLWAKLHLPAPPRGTKWTGDMVMDFAVAQSKLYGIVGADTGANSIEVMAQRLPTATAQPVIHALNLKPVYIITRRGGKQTFTGIWAATFGELRMKQVKNRVTGTYTTNEGSLEGSIVRGVLNFRWYEKGNNSHGTGRFTLSEDGRSFTGTWNYGDDPDAPGSAWTGTRQK
jgi:hypothetical protein